MNMDKAGIYMMPVTVFLRVCKNSKVHSLSAGGPGASSALLRLWGSPLNALFPQESRTFRSNQQCFMIECPLSANGSDIYVMLAFFMFWINVKQIQKRNRLAFFDRLLPIQD